MKKTFDSNNERIDFDKPHVVFKNAKEEIVFGQYSKNYHSKLEIIKICPNFQTAAKLVKKLIKP